MADITPTDVHTPVPLGGKKKRAPGGAFLARLYASLKERMAGAGFLSADEFATVFRGARGHAGGKAKAEKMLIAAEGDYSGVAVVLPVPPELAQTLALPDGLPAADLHLTICMLGDTESMGGVALAEALLAVRDAGLIAGPVTARISGIGRFMGGDQDAIYLSVDSPDLNDLWDIVCDELEEAGIAASEEHGFTPHITLAYIDPGAPVPLDTITEQSITFTQLALWVGTSRTSVPLLGMGDDGDGDVDGAAALPSCPQCGADVVAGADVCMNCGASLGVAGLMAALGANADGTPIPNDQLMTELADMAAAGHTHRLFNSIAFAEAPAWIPYLPKPGVYAHPRYGPITITTERNQRFVSNFAAKVYQDRLPIDAEHETKLSGAVGWVVDMRQNADGSADAQIEWTDRGKAFFAADRFRYFSPEWYDMWEDPATRTQYQDVAIGGALCTRPFFKPPALRPLFASEQGITIDESDPQLQGDLMDAQQFAELETKIKALESENTSLKSASEAATAQSTQLAEQVQRMAAERQQERFGTLIRNDGARWFGESSQHLSVLGVLAQTYGEDSAELKAYVAQQQGIAAALRASSAFNEIGGDGGGRTEDASAKLDRLAKERATKDGISYGDALSKVAAEQPDLYAQHSNAAYVRTKGAE